MKRKALVYLLILILVFGFGCSANEEMTSEDMTMEAPAESQAPEGFGEDEAKYGGIQTDRKVIQRAYIVMETLTFDETVDTIKDKTYEYKGYFETMRVDGKRMDRPDDEQYRNAYFVIRIPKDKYEHFLNAFEKMGNIIVNELNSQDVTDEYIDTEARLKTLKVQEERLLDILETATDVEDIIVLEKRLSEVRYDIEGYTGTIRKWDNLVEFTTVELRISEVQEVSEPEPERVMSRSVKGFKESMENVVEIFKGLVVFTFRLAPYLVFIVPIGLGVVYVMKRIEKKERRPRVKKEKPQKTEEDK